MRIKIQKISSDDLMYVAIVMLVFLTCFPITMCLPSSIRYALQIMAMLFFFLGLVMSRNAKRIFLFIIIVTVMLIRVYFTWQYRRSFTSCAFNVYASWAFAFYGFSIYKDNNNKERYKKLFTLLFIMISFTAVTTIIGIQRYPLVVRELGRSTKSYSGATGSDFSLMKWEYRLSNIAGWNQLYGMVFLLPVFLYAYTMTKKKLLLLGSALIEFCIIRSQLTFAVLLSIVLVLFSFIKPNKNKNKLALELFLLFLGIIAVLNIDNIILLMVRLTSSRSMVMLSNKLYDLYLLLQGVNTGDALSRTSMYSLSIGLFKQHPLIGQALYGVDSPYMFSYHSDFLDMLGYYGLFGLALVVIGIVIYYRFIKTTDAPKWLSFVLFLCFFAMYVFNPIWYSPQIFIGVFLMPAILSKVFNNQVVTDKLPLSNQAEIIPVCNRSSRSF